MIASSHHPLLLALLPVVQSRPQCGHTMAVSAISREQYGQTFMERNALRTERKKQPNEGTTGAYDACPSLSGWGIPARPTDAIPANGEPTRFT